MDIKELNSLTALRVSNTSYPKFMEIMKALKDDSVFQRDLMDAVRNYPSPVGEEDKKASRVGKALMLGIYRFVEAEILK